MPISRSKIPRIITKPRRNQLVIPPSVFAPRFSAGLEDGLSHAAKAGHYGFDPIGDGLRGAGSERHQIDRQSAAAAAAATAGAAARKPARIARRIDGAGVGGVGDAAAGRVLSPGVTVISGRFAGPLVVGETLRRDRDRAVEAGGRIDGAGIGAEARTDA